jgi:hypothetical protein
VVIKRNSGNEVVSIHVSRLARHIVRVAHQPKVPS